MSKTHFLKISKGFALVELVIVIVVMGIALAPIGVMFHQVMVKYAEPEAYQVAATLAEGEMERVTGLSFLNIANDGPTAFSNFPNYTYQVTVGTIAGEIDTSKYKQVEVLVSNSVLGINVRVVTIVSIKQDIS